MKEYDQAATAFQSHIDKVKDDKVRLTDAYLRLGDCLCNIKVLASYGCLQ
jgi:hypothetical protein